MHKERIIDGIEKVFEGYARDEELREALKASHQHLMLFVHEGIGYFLTPDRGVLMLRGYGLHFSSSKDAAQDYFERKSPATPTEAKKMLEEDLGKRVEALKRDYARHFDNERARQAEGKYVLYPEV